MAPALLAVDCGLGPAHRVLRGRVCARAPPTVAGGSGAPFGGGSCVPRRQRSEAAAWLSGRHPALPLRRKCGRAPTCWDELWGVSSLATSFSLSRGTFLWKVGSRQASAPDSPSVPVTRSHTPPSGKNAAVNATAHRIDYSVLSTPPLGALGRLGRLGPCVWGVWSPFLLGF